MRKLVAGILARLRPGEAELRELIARETDPRFAAAFRELTPGPLGAAVLLVVALAAGGILAPLRLLRPRR